jgi:hypothetical protein
MFSILIHRKALKEIDGFPAEDKQRILTAIREMATDPLGGDVKPIKLRSFSSCPPRECSKTILGSSLPRMSRRLHHPTLAVRGKIPAALNLRPWRTHGFPAILGIELSFPFPPPAPNKSFGKPSDGTAAIW